MDLHRLVTNGCSYETVGVGKRGEQKHDQWAKIICYLQVTFL